MLRQDRRTGFCLALPPRQGHTALWTPPPTPLIRGLLRPLAAVALLSPWLFFGSPEAFAANSIAIIPQPQVLVTNAGVFTLCSAPRTPGVPARAATTILADASSRQTAEYLAMALFRPTGNQFPISTWTGTNAVKGAILLTTGSATNLGPEGYELTVAPDSVVIRAPQQGGMFYGVQSFLQLLPPEIFSPQPATGVVWTAACAYVQDWPRFSWRGFMLDPARHFFNKAEVKQMIDAMAMQKINMFHIHLCDDSGWRLEIKKWPLLHQSSAWRTDITGNDPTSHLWNLNPRSMTAFRDDGQYGGYYTQDDMREIVAYATQRHITVVPEIELCGHSTAALSAYPQFSCTSQCPACYPVPYSLSVTAYNGGVFCLGNPATMGFMQDILTEVMSIFPSQYIHVGGDEVTYFGDVSATTYNWRHCPLDQAAMAGLGTTSSSVYQTAFEQQLANWLKSKGRTMVGWSEIENGGLVTGAVCADWCNQSGSYNSSTKATLAATNGQYVVMSPSAVFYINYWETALDSSGRGVLWSNEPPVSGGVCPMANIYAYEPIPSSITNTIYTNYILGTEAPAWSEWIPSLENLQFRTFPRVCALAEMNWTQPGRKDWNSFTSRLSVQAMRLNRMGVNYNPYATPPVLGGWSSAPPTYQTFTWDITSSVTNTGDITASFCWKAGANGVDIAWAALLENGKEIDRDTHLGMWTNGVAYKPVYVLHLPYRRPGATYSLSASMQGHGGTTSIGTIYRPNWE